MLKRVHYKRMLWIKSKRNIKLKGSPYTTTNKCAMTHMPPIHKHTHYTQRNTDMQTPRTPTNSHKQKCTCYMNILVAQSYIRCSCVYICTHKQISHISHVHTQIYTHKPHKHTYMTKHTAHDHMIHRKTHKLR